MDSSPRSSTTRSRTGGRSMATASVSVSRSSMRSVSSSTITRWMTRSSYACAPPTATRRCSISRCASAVGSHSVARCTSSVSTATAGCPAELVEDRETPGLYLEMTDDSVDEYTRARVPEVLSLAGVERATWWRNVKRDRDDLPRVLPEFDLLAVYEVGREFVVPAPPRGTTAHHFVRTTRPAQGCLTSDPTIGLSLVLVSPKARSQAQEFRDWADFVHISHIAAVGVPGFTMITPYENAAGDDPLFLHFYEMDTDDPEDAFQSMPRLVAERLGGVDSDEFKQWAWCRSLRIMYVNSFARVGVSERA